MTYAMYTRANWDPQTLLNTTVRADLASEAFTVFFFQHFVSSNVSLDTGSWAYQSINASVPLDLELIMDFSPS